MGSRDRRRAPRGTASARGRARCGTDAAAPAPTRRPSAARASARSAGWTATRPRSWTKRRPPDRASRPPRRSGSARRRGGQLGDAGGVAGEVRRDQVGEVPHRGQRAIERLALQHQRRGGSGASDLVPRRARSARARGSPRPRPRGRRRPRGSNAWPGALAHEAHGVLFAAEQALEGGVASRRGRSASASGICSPLARRSGPLPSQRSVRWARRLRAPSRKRRARSASIPATSQAAVRAGRCSRAILGSRRAVWTARTSAGLPGSGSARSSPVRTSRPDPYMTGLKLRGQRTAEDLRGDVRPRSCSPRARAGRRSRSARPSRRSTPSRSASRIAISVVCNPCSNGNPMPRSVARQSAAATSAARTRSGCCGASAGTPRHTNALGVSAGRRQKKR